MNDKSISNELIDNKKEYNEEIISTQKKVSIIVPVYKSEMFLEKLIDSMINQTYKNLEIILVDDGSPDKSGEICDYYSNKDKRIKVIHKKNSGTCEARNVGLKAATGELLMFADGDDWFELDCVAYLVNLMESCNAEMAMTDCIFTTRNRKQVAKDNIRKWDREQAVCGILYVDIPVGPWNKIYTTKIIKENNISFSVPWFGEGLYFSVMAAQYSNYVAVGHRKIYNYRLNNPNSGTTVRNVQHGINALENIKYIRNKLVVKTNNTINSANWHIWRNCFNLIVFIVGSNAKKKYEKEFLNAYSELKRLFIPVLFKSRVNIVQKAFIVSASLLPVMTAKLVLWRKERAFQKDLNNYVK